MLRKFLEKMVSAYYSVYSATSFTLLEDVKKDTLKFVTVNGHEFEVNINKITFILERKHFFFTRRRRFHLYDVSANVPSVMSDDFKFVFSSTTRVPGLLSRYAKEEDQVNAVIKAFLDLKINELKLSMKQSSSSPAL